MFFQRYLEMHQLKIQVQFIRDIPIAVWSRR